MAGQSVVISVLADTKPFKRGMDDAGKSTGGLLGGLNKLAKGAAVVGAAAALAVGSIGVTAFKAVAEVERLAAQTSAAIESTGGAAGRSLDEINGMADGLERLTGIEAENITAGQNLLLTFTNIKGTRFDEATKSALDMSVAMGTDMKSAATLVGKALNDPIKGVSALSRVGVQLTDSQKETIKSLTEMGDVAGAQGIILEELNRQFGGSAEAFGGTFLGTVEKVKNAFGTVTESMVQGLLPGATAALNGVNDLLLKVADSPTFQRIIEQVNGFLETIFSGESGFTDLAGKILDVAVTASPLSALFTVITDNLPLVQDLAAQIGDGLGQALDALLPVLPPLAQAFITILSAVLPLVPVVLQLVLAFVPLLEPLLSLIGTILPPLAELLGVILPPAVALVAGILTTVLVPALTFVVDWFSGVFEAAEILVKFFTGEFSTQDVLDQLNNIGGPVGAVLGWFRDLGIFIGTFIRDSRIGFQNFVGDVRANIDGAVGFITGLPGRILGAIGSLGSLLFNSGRDLIQGFINGISQMVGNVSRAVGGIMSTVRGFFPNSPAKRGPFSGEGWRSLQRSGKALFDQFTSGASGDVALEVKPTMAGYAFTTDGGGGRPALPPLSIHVGDGVFLTQAQVGRAIQEALDEWQRVNGGSR